VTRTIDATRRSVLLSGLAGAATLALAACGDSKAGPSSRPTTTGDASGDGAFPVSLEHRYGTTTIPSAPTRIVTVGLTEQDALLALGIVPVATTEWLGAYDGEVGPWATERLGGAALPKVLSNADGIEFEKIAALRPDLILGLYSDLAQADYAKLSVIAPTVAAPPGVSDFGIGWDVATRTIGAAVGLAGQAEELVAGVEASFASYAQANPAFGGASAAVATPYEGYFVFGASDPRTQLLTRLGFTFPTALDEFVGDEYGKSLSEELAGKLDLDALVWLLDHPKSDTAKLHSSSSVYARLPVVTESREVLIDSASDYGNAISFVSVLTLPYVLTRLVPQLADAVS
jgi:iron complex transport system substrate-binding protein